MIVYRVVEQVKQRDNQHVRCSVATSQRNHVYNSASLKTPPNKPVISTTTFLFKNKQRQPVQGWSSPFL